MISIKNLSYRIINANCVLVPPEPEPSLGFLLPVPQVVGEESPRDSGVSDGTVGARVGLDVGGM